MKPFLMSGMKIQKLDRLALELSDYNLNFVHIKGNENVLADTILHLKSKTLYHEPLQGPKTMCCLDIPLVTTTQPNADSPITTELLIEEQRKMNSVEHWQQNFTSPDMSKTSISHT